MKEAESKLKVKSSTSTYHSMLYKEQLKGEGKMK